MNSALKLLLDSYDRKTQLYPALLTLLPLLCASFALYPSEIQAAGSLVSIGMFCGFGSFLSSIGRTAGKQIEGDLYREWGGKPSTQLLRHSNKDLSSATRMRYHEWLQSLVPGIQMPTEDREKADSEHADDVYSSCGDWLRERTRNREAFPRVYRELVNYGFCRNLFELKSLGLSLALAGLVLGVLRIAKVLQIGSDAMATVSLALSAVMLAFWLFWVRRALVRITAFAYADALLASLQRIVEQTAATKE